MNNLHILIAFCLIVIAVLIIVFVANQSNGNILNRVKNAEIFDEKMIITWQNGSKDIYYGSVTVWKNSKGKRVGTMKEYDLYHIWNKYRRK